MASESWRNERLSVSYFLVPTGLKSLWWAISKMTAVSLYWFEFIFVTGISRYELYNECIFNGAMQIVSFECDAYRTASVSMLKCHQVKHYGVYVMYNEDILRIIHAEERCNGVQNIYITSERNSHWRYRIIRWMIRLINMLVNNIINIVNEVGHSLV